MKKLLLSVVLAVMLAGCAGITADARHAALIDTTAATAYVIGYKANVPDVCKDATGTVLDPCDCVGEFTKTEAKEILQTNATLWMYFQAAKNGQGTFPTTPLLGE